MSPAQVYISLYYSQGGRICVTDTDTDTALPPVIARIRRENGWPCRLQALTIPISTARVLPQSSSGTSIDPDPDATLRRETASFGVGAMIGFGRVAGSKGGCAASRTVGTGSGMSLAVMSRLCRCGTVYVSMYLWLCNGRFWQAGELCATGVSWICGGDRRVATAGSYPDGGRIRSEYLIWDLEVCARKVL